MKKKQLLYPLAAIVCFAAVFAGVYLALRGGNENPPKESTSSDTPQGVTTTLYRPPTAAPSDETTPPPQGGEDAAAYAQAYAYAGFHPKLTHMDAEKWYLMLVNGSYVMPQDYLPELAPSVSADSSSPRLDARVAEQYNAMYLAAKADGVTLTPISGYRSMERQRNNFEAEISAIMKNGYSRAQATQMAAKAIMIPGASEHNAGLCMDIGDIAASFARSDAYAWLVEHAAEFGFIERYQQAKVDITKVKAEPWHWRYVGAADAKAMKESGQCLEEYLGKS